MQSFLAIGFLSTIFSILLASCGADKFVKNLFEPQAKDTAIKYDVLDASPAATSADLTRDAGEPLATDINLENGIDINVSSVWKRDIDGRFICQGGQATLRKRLAASLTSGTIFFDYSLEKRPVTAKFLIRVYNNVNPGVGFSLFNYDDAGVFADSDKTAFPRLSETSPLVPLRHQVVSTFQQNNSVRVRVDALRPILDTPAVNRNSNLAPSISVEARIVTQGTPAATRADLCEENQLRLRVHALKISSQQAVLP